MNTTTLRSDKRAKPELVNYEILTFEECKALTGHSKILDRHGKLANVKITSVKSWKRRPSEIEVRCQFGLYEYFTIRIDRENNPNTELVKILY